MKHDSDRTRAVQTGHYVGMEFEQGWFFVNVTQTEQIDLKPYTLLNENENRAEIAAQTAGSPDDEIVDSVERKLVTPRDNEQNLIFQLLVGVAPSRVQIYPFFGRDSAPNLTGGAEPGDNQIPFNGYDSPYNDPTLQAEFFTVNDQEPLQLQAYNPTSEPVEAKLSFHVNKFKYTVVEDTDLMRAFLEGQVNFRDHAMGLGAQTSDQIRAPGWLSDRFGDVIKSTRDIYNESSSGGQLPDASQDAIPDTQMG
jgi:hypothetical protein